MRLKRILVLIGLLSVGTGCSVVGKISEATLEAGTIGWQLQPVSVRTSYPEFIQKVYFTAELFTSETTDWEIYLVTKEPLPDQPDNAYIELSYQKGDEMVAGQFPLTLVSQHLEDSTTAYRYKYKLDKQAQAFFSEGMQQRLSRRAKTMRFNYLQPLFYSQATQQQITQMDAYVEYALLPDYGPLNLGEFMRKLSFLGDDDWVNFCLDSHYIYDKTSACGEVSINEQMGLSNSL
ncbi:MULTISPECIES: hypothetical protein [Pseudoalteromonas]|uniref:Lipoprotein n=1 Tax=Pseudoalteromonas amylolytica TaxID=1859457 RepID=A0A1S1MRS3_9GAMM|nr:MULTISPECIES: hypothetical protein [Pseudoalteromonas]OHU85998.1 hypothetical protein BFC16_17200 [Pseudoalteromonas sp. JW3]OHU89392.1 hypothetical protein BET10_17375 [Pseudoalteromonas amylolytica]